MLPNRLHFRARLVIAHLTLCACSVLSCEVRNRCGLGSEGCGCFVHATNKPGLFIWTDGLRAGQSHIPDSPGEGAGCVHGEGSSLAPAKTCFGDISCLAKGCGCHSCWGAARGGQWYFAAGQQAWCQLRGQVLILALQAFFRPGRPACPGEGEPWTGHMVGASNGACVSGSHHCLHCLVSPWGSFSVDSGGHRPTGSHLYSSGNFSSGSHWILNVIRKAGWVSE